MGKVQYIYGKSGKVQNIVTGDTKTILTYGLDSLLSSVVNEEVNNEYRQDFVYRGNLLKELRTEYSARTGLSNAKFTYEYDDNMRLIKTAGRIGGQQVDPVSYSYSTLYSLPVEVGNFVFSRSMYNSTKITDGTAIFTRRTDNRFRTIYNSIKIQNVEVYTRHTLYNNDDRISRTITYTNTYSVSAYTTIRNYTYDVDGQLISVSDKEPWTFTYDPNGNMISLTYATNTIPMKYNQEDKITNFGEGFYKYNERGFISKNVREVSYKYNSKGLLVKASKADRFEIDYVYDHKDRLVARKDNFQNVTQFHYGDPAHPERVTHVYSSRDAVLSSLLYDDRGHLMYAQIQRKHYYIATDENGTPTMIMDQYGEVIREMMRSPYGQIIYDSNSYFYMPIDFSGGIQDIQTELVHMPRGKVYDPLIGMWLTPQIRDVAEFISQPHRLHMYRPHGNDPVNVHKDSLRPKGIISWLRALNMDLSSLAPSFAWSSEQASVLPVSENSPNKGTEDRMGHAFAAASEPNQVGMSSFAPYLTQGVYVPYLTQSVYGLFYLKWGVV